VTGKKNRSKCAAAGRQDGFSVLEVIISMAVLTVGLVGLLGVMGLAMASTQSSEQLAIAKRLANEALESILTARETANVQWSQIANGSCAIGDPTGCGIFLPNAQPINLPGADGIIGTNDDAAAGPEVLDSPGADGVFHNSCPAGPDVCTPLTNYTRTIAITPFVSNGVADANLNTITITVTYTNPQFRAPQSYVLQTLISQYR